jgi:PAS domain S-box-containing protein
LKRKQEARNNELISGLRDKAEQMLLQVGKSKSAVDKLDIDSIFQELQIHQIELEMQNDELKLANEELELQQLKFTSIYNLAPVSYFILNANGIIDEVNNAGLSLLVGLKTGLIGKRITHFIAADHTDAFYRFFRAMQTGEERQTCQLKMRSPAGAEFYAQVEGIKINSLISGFAQYYIAIIDITERIEAGKALSATKERLQLSLEASSAGIWELELQTMHFFLDEFNQHICGIPTGRFDGKYHTFINTVHPDDQQTVDYHFRVSINHEKELDIVCRLGNNDNELCYVSIRGHVVGDAGQPKRLVGIMIDVTDKKRIEEETQRLKDSQQTAIMLATLNAEENERRRISDALHDSVSQLLYGIKMKLGALNADHTPAGNDVNQLLDQAIRETRNISFELAPSILVDFGLPATIEELVKRLSTPAMKIEARITGFGNRTDLLLETSIFRIVQELINNCMKHSGASLVKLELKKNKQIEIKIKDNGRGFNYTEQEKSAGGSGLHSIKNRVGLYNGKLIVDSQINVGTAINISLSYKPKV